MGPLFKNTSTNCFGLQVCSAREWLQICSASWHGLTWWGHKLGSALVEIKVLLHITHPEANRKYYKDDEVLIYEAVHSDMNIPIRGHKFYLYNSMG